MCVGNKMGVNGSVHVRDLQDNAHIRRLVGKEAVSEGDAFWEEMFKFFFKMPTERLVICAPDGKVIEVANRRLNWNVLGKKQCVSYVRGFIESGVHVWYSCGASHCTQSINGRLIVN